MGQMSNYIFTDAFVIDCTDEHSIFEGWVVVENDRIKEVGKGKIGTLPENSIVINCHGQTLLPGLIDCHVHMSAIDANLVELNRRNFPSEIVIKSLSIIRDTLEQGFTTARDCGWLDLGFKKALNDGLISGPRVFISGQPLTQTGGHGDFRLPTESYETKINLGVCDGVDEVRKGAREQIRRGVDFIKIMAGGGAASPSDEIDTSQYSLEEMQAIVFEAQSAGKYVAAHCYSDRSIELCCNAGVRTIEHGNLLTESAAKLIKEKGSYLVPTIVTYVMISKMGKELGLSDDMIRKINQALEKAQNSLSIAYSNGLKIGSGSDLLGPMQIFKGLELELQAEIMGPMNALLAATKVNAEIIKQEKDLGTIEAGKIADLILLKGNPIDKISLFQKYQENITFIMQNGKAYKNIIS
jgi:imidazolonepropionase-like amidohydrolase